MMIHDLEVTRKILAHSKQMSILNQRGRTQERKVIGVGSKVGGASGSNFEKWQTLVRKPAKT